MKESLVTFCLDQATEIPGTWDVCQECALKVYVADSTREVANQHGRPLKILCIWCFQHLQGPIKINPLTDKQMKELKEEVKKHSC